jgi:hypothetical protein
MPIYIVHYTIDGKEKAIEMEANCATKARSRVAAQLACKYINDKVTVVKLGLVAQKHMGEQSAGCGSRTIKAP